MAAHKILILICLISTVACSKNSGEEQAPTVTTYVVKGDPQLVIQGSQLKSESPYTALDVADLNNFSLTAMVSFVEREKPSSAEELDLEHEQAPSDGHEPKKYRLSLIQLDAVHYKSSLAGLGLNIFFKLDGNSKLQITSLATKEESMDVRALHWSRTPDNNQFSVLLEFADPVAGKTLVALYFQRESSQKTIPKLNPRFQYIAGPGNGISWDPSQTLKIEVCSNSTILAATQSAMLGWQTALQNRLPLQIVQATQFAPFTDLNQHCLYVVDTYISEARKEVANFGVTIPIMNRQEGRIIDSDIIIFKTEFEKLRAPVLAAGGNEWQLQQIQQRYMQITLVHELGHLLGLDHQFDKAVPSIMSYKFDDASLKTYDVEAVQALYPLLNTQPANQNARY